MKYKARPEEITDDVLDRIFFKSIREIDDVSLVNEEYLTIYFRKALDETRFGYSTYVSIKEFPGGAKGLEINHYNMNSPDAYVFYLYDDIISDILYRNRIDKIDDLLR